MCSRARKNRFSRRNHYQYEETIPKTDGRQHPVSVTFDRDGRSGGRAALGVIQEYCQTSLPPVLVQMMIGIPAIFIVITNSIFPRLCKRFGAKALIMIGLLLYTVGGCIAGAARSFWC